MAETLYALSIRQPWAALIVAGRKTVEVRSWPTRRRGRILIHASSIPADAPDLWAALTDDVRALAQLRGGVVGVAEVIDCKGYIDQTGFDADSDLHWNPPENFELPRFGFVLRDARPVPFVRTKGNTGFFRVEWTPPAGESA